MSKAYIIVTYNDVEVIDTTPEAEDRIASMEYAEERFKRELKRTRHKGTKKILSSFRAVFD